MNGTMRLTHNQYFAVLAGLFSLLWLALAVSPVSRSAWALENVLVVAFILSLWFLRRWFTFSRISITLIFLYLCLHEIGAHYTYSEVPYDAWIKSLTGYSLNETMGWSRNPPGDRPDIERLEPRNLCQVSGFAFAPGD